MADKISIAINNRYNAAYVITGRVPVKGFELDVYDYSAPGRTAPETFNRQYQELTWDLVDMPFTNFLIARDLGKPLIGLPSFPTLFNPLCGPMVNRSNPIHTARGLEGKRVGTMGLAFNPSTWLRGILQHHYGADIYSIQYVENEPNSMSSVPYPRPDSFKVEKAQGVMGMLNRGEVDCVFNSDGGPEPTDVIDRLFPDYWNEVQAYYDATGVLPINSVLVAKE
jgi:4,5-dihydroxyphthalate decarboxylase